MELDYNAMRFWWEAAMTVGLLLNFAYNVVVSRSKANRAAIDRVDGRVSELADRVTLLERDVRHLPDHGDLAELHEKVNVIANGMGKIEGELSALVRGLSMIHEHMLERAGK